MTVAFVYPGQGAQRPGMLSDLPCVPEVDQTLAEAGRLIPGGIGTLDHLRALAGLSLDGVIVGKALYERRFTVAEANAALAG